MELVFFDQALEKFIQSLKPEVIAKILRTIGLLEKFSYQLGMPHSKKVAQNLFELRIHGEQAIRIFYTFHQSRIVLLHGFNKKSQKIPSNELKTAMQRLKNLLAKK
jgi:phage-related protein